MPRKKKAETVSTTPKAASKPAAKPKAAPKPARATAKKMAAPKASRAAKTSPQKAALKAGVASKTSASGWKKPARQGETQMVAFIRDPHCIFTYWEVTPQSIEEVKQKLVGEYKDSAMVLRIFRTGQDGQAELIQEIRVEPGEMNRYVELKESAAGSYFVEIAQKTASGRMIVYARSNKVMTGTVAGGGNGSSGETSTPQWETPAGLLEYFTEAEEASDVSALRGLSSAEAHRKALLRKQMGRYSASRMG